MTFKGNSNDSGGNKVTELKQPKTKSSFNVLECVRKAFKHVRHQEVLSIVVICVKADGTHYVDIVCPIDAPLIDDTLEAMSNAHEAVYSIGK